MAQVGGPAPGLPAGTIFTGLLAPTINATGTVAFNASLTGPGVSASTSLTLWTGVPGALELLARAGDPAPSTGPGVVFNSLSFAFSPPVIAADGTVTFYGTLRGPGVVASNDMGIWRGEPGNIELVAREGDPAPGTETGTIFSFISQPSAASNGGVTFSGTLTGPSVTPGIDNFGLWAGLPGAVTLLARAGRQAPGLAPGTNITAVGNSQPRINNEGGVLFTATVAGAGSALFLGPPGAIQPIAVSGNPVPEVNPGVTFRTVAFETLSTSPLSINDNGLTSYTTTLNPFLVTQNSSVFRADGSGRELVARDTQPAPGAGPGSVFGGIFSTAINRDGIVALTANLARPGENTVTTEGIWLGGPSNLAPLALLPSVLPTQAGNFDLFSIGNPVINARGLAAFAGSVRPVSGGPISASIWLGTPGALSPAVIAGQAIDFGGGDVRTAQFIFTGYQGKGSGNQDGRPSAFSDNGQVAFVAGLPTTPAIIVVPPVSPVAVIEDVEVGDAWKSIVIPKSLDTPVVIAGTPSFKNKQPGLIRLRNLAPGRVEARFQEWRYLDDKHPGESLAMMVLGKGRHKMADGSIWEAGVLKVRNNRKWKRKKFKKRFRRRPELFLMVQSNRGKTPVTVRARNVTKRGFEAALQEEERDLKSGHPRETVGYVAVFNKKRKGSFGGGLNYKLDNRKINQRFKKTLGVRLKLEEERSLGRETRHGKERVSAIRLGRGIFAQQTTDREPDTTTIRWR